MSKYAYLNKNNARKNGGDLDGRSFKLILYI